MALNYQQPRDPGEEVRNRWSRGLEGIFEAYQTSKQNAQGQARMSKQDALAAEVMANAEKDRQAAGLLQYGFDPRQMTHEVLRRANMGIPQGPASPGMASPEQRELAEHPLAGPVRAFLENKRAAAARAATGAQLDQDKTRSEINKNDALADAAGQEQVYVDPDTGKQIVVPRGAKLIPRPSKGKPASNQDLNSAMELYETAKEGLISGLGGSETGQLVGRLPAITAKQQIAKGSVAAMAPVLKQIFRTAGEGVFTDRDQQLLLDMIPTRTELPEARAAMIENIDRIVKAKIKSGMRQTQAAPETQTEAAPISLTGAKAARLAELRAKRGR